MTMDFDKLQKFLVTSVSPQADILSEWVGEGFRFSSRRYADEHTFTDGLGATLQGARFTPLGGPRTLYLATEPETAMAEMLFYQRKHQLGTRNFQPRLLAAVAVCVGKMLDMTSSKIQQQLGLSIEILSDEWEPYQDRGEIAPSQELGRMISEAGIEGFLAPSVRREGGVNIVLFPENFVEGSHAIMLNSHS